MFRAFARRRRPRPGRLRRARHRPTGHSLLLLDATQSYHRDVARGLSDVPDSRRATAPAAARPRATPGC